MNRLLQNRNALFSLIAFLSAAVIAGATSAQDAYPSKPVTLIVPFPPGGVADIVGRPFAEALSRELKTPVDHREQAGCGRRHRHGRRRQGRSPTATRCCWRCRRSRSCPKRTRCSVARRCISSTSSRRSRGFTADPTVLAVRADSPWKTLQDFVADARSRPGAITYGSLRQLRNDARADGDVRAQRRRQAAARPVHRRRPRGHRAARRASRRAVDRPIHRIAARQGRQGARARVMGRSSACVAARRADADRVGLRRRLLPVVARCSRPPERRSRSLRACAKRRVSRPRTRASSARWRPSKRRSSISTRRRCGASGRRTPKSSPTPCSASERSNRGREWRAAGEAEPEPDYAQ